MWTCTAVFQQSSLCWSHLQKKPLRGDGGFWEHRFHFCSVVQHIAAPASQVSPHVVAGTGAKTDVRQHKNVKIHGLFCLFFLYLLRFILFCFYFYKTIYTWVQSIVVNKDQTTKRSSEVSLSLWQLSLRWVCFLPHGGASLLDFQLKTGEISDAKGSRWARYC